MTSEINSGLRFEFHIARKARKQYEFDDLLFATTGNVILADFQAARRFAHKINQKRDLLRHPEQAVRASEINAMGLLDEVLHGVVELYRQQVNPKAFQRALDWLNEHIGIKKVDRALLRFVEMFPGSAVYQKGMKPDAFLDGATGDTPHRLLVLEELLMLWVSNRNPALEPFFELFDDAELEENTAYSEVIQEIGSFFKTQPPFGPDELDIVSLLRQPAIACPGSLADQLKFVFSRWGGLVSKFSIRLLGSLDFLREESKPGFLGPGPTEVTTYAGIAPEYEPEQFSADLHWMPELVLIAKSTLVWMDQLAKEYGRPINRLDEIPDQELDKLADWGFTGLWLIGIWRRSEASRTIKRSCGNPEAESSAYSLFDYEIAPDLGGYDALQNLKHRCWQRGIRLACDMVPNHTGIDSRWLREHPDWYISLPYSPFPAYSFSGQNLSQDPRFLVQIEDKYYNQTDAAVVFRREDTWSGDVRYIYHGNDGTSMPWNDTAQLNYLNPEVREAVIRKIIDVARMFSVIRFDAAMTLAKKHYQRLWFPEPGSGGDIPSRAQFGLTRQQFDAAMPKEFWREVVDRVAQEVPECLLLAEAFWMMEGYFVRTLGMHRVYNSAFMNMLKNEDNQKYRQSVINTLQFNPEILKRFVNFMNNPDEETAIRQFGDSDKYFGVCLMMVTMPGLPMFGHGQVEGFHEKYGMEYRRSYWEEKVNQPLVERHKREIFPLMKKRYLFANVDNFLFYDFVSSDGYVNENVFVYSNRVGWERAIVIYNNKFEHAAGWIRASVPYAVKSGEGNNPNLVQKSLRQGLDLQYDDSVYLIFRDHVSGLEYIRHSKEVCDRGLYFELGAFKYQVIMNLYEIHDNEYGHYGQLNAELAGRGVPSIADALRELSLRPLLRRADAILNNDRFSGFLQARLSRAKDDIDSNFIGGYADHYHNLVEIMQAYASAEDELEVLVSDIKDTLQVLLSLQVPESFLGSPRSKATKEIRQFMRDELDDGTWCLLYCWLTVHQLGRVSGEDEFVQRSEAWLHQWLLGARCLDLMRSAGALTELNDDAGSLLAILVRHQRVFQDVKSASDGAEILQNLLSNATVQAYLNVNRHDGILWFQRENFERLAKVLFVVNLPALVPKKAARKGTARHQIPFDIIRHWMQILPKSEYRVEKLVELAAAE